MLLIIHRDIGMRDGYCLRVYRSFLHRNSQCNAMLTAYTLGLLPPHYPVPAIPIEVDWTDADMGFIDLFIGIDPCKHVVFYKD